MYYANSEASVNYVVIFIGLICLTLIFLPVVGSPDSTIPVYMHMTYEAKMFASLVLGKFSFRLNYRRLTCKFN